MAQLAADEKDQTNVNATGVEGEIPPAADSGGYANGSRIGLGSALDTEGSLQIYSLDIVLPKYGPVALLIGPDGCTLRHGKYYVEGVVFDPKRMTYDDLKMRFHEMTKEVFVLDQNEAMADRISTNNLKTSFERNSPAIWVEHNLKSVNHALYYDAKYDINGNFPLPILSNVEIWARDADYLLNLFAAAKAAFIKKEFSFCLSVMRGFIPYVQQTRQQFGELETEIGDENVLSQFKKMLAICDYALQDEPVMFMTCRAFIACQQKFIEVQEQGNELGYPELPRLKIGGAPTYDGGFVPFYEGLCGATINVPCDDESDDNSVSVCDENINNTGNKRKAKRGKRKQAKGNKGGKRKSKGNKGKGKGKKNTNNNKKS